jgi:hypothetical protein|tara:strand:- start:537 stop:851 length:315 start_codon:yes stop_codon:yes gene_type:complete
MIKETSFKSQQQMLNTNVVVNVVHEHFSVDVEYMVFYIKHEGKWLVDTMDWSGDFMNLRIDDIIVSDKECQNYFEIMTKLGINYKDEVLDSVESHIRDMEVKIS